MWDLVPWPGIKLRTPALGAWSLSHWATREVPRWCIYYSGQATSGCDRKPKRQVPLPPVGLGMINYFLQVCAFICFPYSRNCSKLAFHNPVPIGLSERCVKKKKKFHGHKWNQMGWKRVIINQTSWTSFPRVAMTKHYKLGVWEQQSWILCLFQRPEVQDRSVNRAIPPQAPEISVFQTSLLPSDSSLSYDSIIPVFTWFTVPIQCLSLSKLLFF